MTPEPLILLSPHTHDLGGFEVRRVLPGRPQRMVGPFIFFDHVGPARLAAGTGVDVRPHPHIGLATVTYLFDGEFMHRDSLGNMQRIAPGDVNWMTAGRGIVHSERTPAELRTHAVDLHGVQTWVALPKTHEDAEPGFSHLPKATLPQLSDAGVNMSLIVGNAFGARAPTPSFSDIFYLAATLRAGARLELPAEHEERGVYLIDGEVGIDGQTLPAQHMAVLTHHRSVTLRATTAARVMLVGGARMDGERLIWWNFVASSRERIEDAKQRWRERRFAPIPGETEFIPLPER